MSFVGWDWRKGAWRGRGKVDRVSEWLLCIGGFE